ncbi:thioredoxin domain-containing protein [Ferrovibrio sp.]|uniref:thioredoxin domain-containing protein n=1 Tax=Ferrovibrio sp. TaxID=1917215 RepID=UPI0035AF4918
MSEIAPDPLPDPRTDLDRNMLEHAASPYLLQHKDNPVHWQLWGPATLAAAQAANKPILLSVGYAACHWCHVMAHESFENPAIAALMNRLFVNIKVDREERPDIDAIYMNALHLLGEQGGWPLTMFLTPDGAPFWGGTYFPPESRYGRPGFPDVLQKVFEAWHDKPEAVNKNKTMLLRALRESARPQNAESIVIDAGILDQVAEQLHGHVDPEHGGIGGAPKFPQSGLFDLLWAAYLRSGNAGYRHAVLNTAAQMAQGGIYDHLAGGFARYSTDAEWLAPHFEKMLYDNAQLLEHFALLDADADSHLLRQRIYETVDWLRAEMLQPGGGFAAALDADSEGEEGKFYVWQAAEIEAALRKAGFTAAEIAAFRAAYDVTDHGNWEEKTILRRSLAPQFGDAAQEAMLARARAALKAVRDTRIRPGLDDKILTDWNGLIIAALAKLARQYKQPDWLALAEHAYGFIVTAMARDGDRLGHSWRDGKLVFPGLLEDYANMARAALALHEATGKAAYLDNAIDWVKRLDADYADRVHGGYFQTARDAETLVARLRNCTDNAVPAGNGTLVGVFARLWYLTGDADWRDRTESQIAAFSGEAARNFFPMAAFLNGCDFYAHAVQVAIIGQRGQPDTEAMIDAAYAMSLPHRVLQVVPPDAALPPSHPAHGKTQLGKTQQNNSATAYVCVGMSCGLPASDAAGLTAQLRATRRV